MSLYRRGKIWWIKLTANGKRIRESSGTSERKKAQEFHEKRRGELWRQVKLGESFPVTWGEAVAKWMAVKPRGLPDRYRIKAFTIPLQTSLPLSRQYVDSVVKATSSGSWNRNIALIIAIHNCSGVMPPKIERRKMPPGRTRWLTAQEWSRLKTALLKESPLLASCAEFTLATGLRENNVLGLTWDQVDLKRRVAWLHGDQTKGGVPIGVPLNDAACAILAIRKGIHKQWIFGNPDYPLYKASNRAWYEALRKARLVGFRWHDLRHTWASWAVMGGVRIEELQRLGGWKTPSMVQRYAHLSSEHLAEAAAKIRPVQPGSGTNKGTLGG